jgi:DNA-binding transcriptional LysR family regulator
MEWNDLRIFLAVARAGTLGGAAKMLGQTQPTMGRHIRRLEQDLGQTLFQRTSDGFVLTDEGAAALAHAERVEEETIAFERQVAGQAGQLDGALRISSSDWFGVHVLTPIFADFVIAHPRVTMGGGYCLSCPSSGRTRSHPAPANASRIRFILCDRDGASGSGRRCRMCAGDDGCWIGRSA